MQSKVIEALLILVENPGQIITRETLRARLWPDETEINYDANVNTTVNKLRHILATRTIARFMWKRYHAGDTHSSRMHNV